VWLEQCSSMRSEPPPLATMLVASCGSGREVSVVIGSQVSCRDGHEHKERGHHYQAPDLPALVPLSGIHLTLLSVATAGSGTARTVFLAETV
jgi:hypothetical protein